MRKTNIYTYFMLTMTIFLFFFYMPVSVHAEESGSFTYRVQHPENQQSDAGYFDLRMMPNQKQIVQIELTNSSPTQPVTVEVKRNAVKTNSNGVLEYGPNTIKNDKSATVNFDTVVNVPKSVTLAGGETKNIDIEIQMPEKSFDGVVAGGIQLQQKENDDEKKQRESQSGVTNRYAFLVGVLLSETDATVPSEITFNSIYPGLSNYRNAVFLNFSNTAMAFTGDVSVEFDIREKGSDNILYDTKKTDMKIAPTSMIDFPLLLNGDEMKAGNYIGHAVVTSGDQRWEWEQDFDITQEDADKYNKQDVSLVQEQGINWQFILLLVGAGVLLLVAISLIIYFIRKNKRRSKSNKTKNKPTNKRKKIR